jgi:pSer/pThr/pTyr-binding forkhead associated (FHA) protein
MIVVYSGENKTNYNFSIKDSPIKLGRGKTCQVIIDSNFLSKKHSTVEYNKNSNLWEISDGNNSKRSLNGTWLLLDTKYEIIEDTFLKIGNNVIKIHIE